MPRNRLIILAGVLLVGALSAWIVPSDGWPVLRDIAIAVCALGFVVLTGLALRRR